MRLWRNYGLSITLLAMFLLSWIGQAYSGWRVYVQQQEQHSQSASFWGEDGYLWELGEATFENWQSEFLQVFVMVVLSTYLIHKGSPQSKDSDEELKQALERIESRLKKRRRVS